MFVIPLVLTLFGGIKKYKNIAILVGALVLFDLFLGAWEGLIIGLGAALVGWLLAQGGLLIYRGLKK
jgi:hypothetical protein